MLARWRGDRGHRLGRTQQCCFYEGGAVDRWERLRGGAFGFSLYKVRNAYASSSTTTSRAMRATCSGSARSPRAARLASSAPQRASAASTPPGLTKRTSDTAAARGIRAPTGPLFPRCVLPPDTHPVHPRLGQGRALGIPISGPHAVNLVNRWWQFHDTQLSSWWTRRSRPWPSTRSAARSGRPRGPATHGPTSTSNRCGSQACTATSAVAVPTLRWLRSRCCGWPTGRVSVDSSSKRMPSQRRLRMPPRRHKTGWPYVDPNPLGTLRQSCTAWGLQLTPGPVMAGGRYGGRPGSDPAGNPPLSRCIRSPIRCSVWMSRKQAASSGEHPELARTTPEYEIPCNETGSTSPRSCGLKLVLEE